MRANKRGAEVEKSSRRENGERVISERRKRQQKSARREPGTVQPAISPILLPIATSATPIHTISTPIPALARSYLLPERITCRPWRAHGIAQAPVAGKNKTYIGDRKHSEQGEETSGHHGDATIQNQGYPHGAAQRTGDPCARDGASGEASPTVFIVRDMQISPARSLEPRSENKR